MAKPIDRLLKFLSVKNVADELDDDDLKRQLVDDVITGYEIDDKSRANWLDTNKQALEIINYNQTENQTPDKTFPFDKACKLVYPLLAPAVLQLASRMIQNLVRNGKVCDFKVLGQDQELSLPDPKTGQPKPTGKGIKEYKAERLSNYINFKLLVESKNWLLLQHKFCTIVAAWGVGYQQVFKDNLGNVVDFELLNPEDVVVNKNIVSLDKARRITLRLYLTKNDILSFQRQQKFSDFDVETLDCDVVDNALHQNDAEEVNPTYEFLKQFCYVDLDDDGIAEPYWIYVHQYSKVLACVEPAFDFNGISTTPQGAILGVKPEMNILDEHLIDNPDGSYYSLGLNQLLLHQNKSITSILRQLVDAGILSNTAGSTGFVTKAFKTKERNLKMKLGEFKVLDVPAGTEIEKQIMNLPFKEPSQVLLALMQFMVETGKETGFMSDVLAGDATQANVPATTMLAMVEQATRAFKPVVQKQQAFLKTFFQTWFKLESDVVSMKDYVEFCGCSPDMCKDDFNVKSFDIAPVADPTMSSEAHKYARIQFVLQLLQQVPGAMNIPETLERILSGIEEPSPEMMIAPPQPPQPNPQLLEVQLKGKVADQEHQIKLLTQQLDSIKVDNQTREVDNKTLLAHLKEKEFALKKQESGVKVSKIKVDAHKESLDLLNQHEMTKIQGFNAVTQRKKIDAMTTEAEKDRQHEKDLTKLGVDSKPDTDSL